VAALRGYPSVRRKGTLHRAIGVQFSATWKAQPAEYDTFPYLHVLPLSNVWREDKRNPAPLRRWIAGGYPFQRAGTRENSLKVKKVIE